MGVTNYCEHPCGWSSWIQVLQKYHPSFFIPTQVLINISVHTPATSLVVFALYYSLQCLASHGCKTHIYPQRAPQESRGTIPAKISTVSIGFPGLITAVWVRGYFQEGSSLTEKQEWGGFMKTASLELPVQMTGSSMKETPPFLENCLLCL